MRAAATRHRPAPAPELPKLRAPLVFGVLALLFFGLVGRSVYLQWIDNEFLQTQGSARHSRDLEVPAHRGRIVDRFGEPLALSTPVKSLWVFPDKFDATPDQLTRLAHILDTQPQRVQAQIDAHDDFAFVARQIAPEDVGARDGAAHQGIARPERVSPLLSGRRGDRARDRLHRRQGRGTGRNGARAADVARGRAGEPPCDHQPAQRGRRGRRRDPRAAGGARPRTGHRLAPAVPRVSRAEGRPSSSTRRRRAGW
jgi:cell division protein FtsI/penicillin-binding protein 2